MRSVRPRYPDPEPHLRSAWRPAAAQSLDAFFRIFRAGSVREAMDLFAGLTFSPFNWVLADERVAALDDAFETPVEEVAVEALVVEAPSADAGEADAAN